MDELEPEPWSAEIADALDEARRPVPLAAERKQALWRSIASTTEQADSDVHAAQPPQTTPDGRRPWVAVVAAVVAVAAAVLVWTATAGPEPASGQLDAAATTTVPLAERGIAVVAKGARVRWRVDDSNVAKITQSTGRVFYRVEPGGPFTVSTPAGEVAVTGTSFEVEMKKVSLGSAAVGGALAAAMVVTVYEGNVVASNGHGEVEVAAGQQTQVVADRAPADATPRSGESDDGGPSPVAVAAAPGTQQLRNRVRQLEAQLAEAREEVRAGGTPDDDDEDDYHTTLFEPSQAHLIEEAKDCRVQWAAPDPAAHGDVPTLRDRDVERMGLTPKERAAIDALTAEVNQGIVETARELYVEATGDEAGVSELSYDAMRSEIFDKASPEDDVGARTQVSLERAGQAQPAADPQTEAATTRLLRAEIARSTRYSERMREVLGAARAREIRMHLPLSVHATGGCAGDE